MRSLVIFIIIFSTSCTLFSCSSSFPTLSHGDKDVRFIRFGNEINSVFDDYAPVILPDGKTLIYTSNRPHTYFKDRNDDVYMSKRIDDRWTAAERIDVSRGKDLNEGSLTFDYARAQIYFSQCFLPDGAGDCDIYVADVKDGKWENIRNLGRAINSIEWDVHPSISRDGNTLYFASSRFGGEGESDIWMSTRQSNETWSTPTNLGPVINTRGDEQSPFISADGKVLYFASKYHRGFGGFDIFRSEKTDKGWTKPLNLGKPYNSSDDDLFFATTPSEDTSFVSSNRQGSLGGLDIYQIIRLSPPISPQPPQLIKPLILQLTVLNEFTLKPVVASIILSTPRKEDMNIETNEQGYAGHEVIPGAKYSITVLASGFLTGYDSFSSDDLAQGEVKKEILLKPIREDERVIYRFHVEFDFDRFHIRPEERKHLDSAVVLLEKYPKSVVVVAGHTDSVGTVQYNMILGWNRASKVSEYVKTYIEEKNVKLINTLEVRSYGKSQPLATNETDEGRQRNRRVEIMIVRYE